MESLVGRMLSQRLAERLHQRPAVALVGPRQVGKTTLALNLIKNEIQSHITIWTLSLKLIFLSLPKLRITYRVIRTPEL